MGIIEVPISLCMKEKGTPRANPENTHKIEKAQKNLYHEGMVH